MPPAKREAGLSVPILAKAEHIMYETQILSPLNPAPELVPSDRTLRYDARTLTGGAGTAYIELDGQIYTLRITKSAKLILTK